MQKVINMQLWQDLPYYPISQYYKKQFGEKVYKIPVSIVDTCPNREGYKEMKTCIFCDEWGSAAYSDSLEKDLHQQISEYHKKLGDRYNSKNFLVYFQSYTNSLMGIEKLRKHYETALSFPFVKGIVIGTRPDCLSPALLKLWQEYSEKTYVGIELGVQSFFKEHTDFLKRGHDGQCSVEAVYKLAKIPKLNIGLHFIFGLPNETEEQILQTAKLCNSLPIHNVKIHNLHVLKNTELEEMYRSGNFQVISLEDFVHHCTLFLEHLSPELPVHRIGAVASRWDQLIAPDWTRHKMYVRQVIVDRMLQAQKYQGRLATNYSGIIPKL